MNRTENPAALAGAHGARKLTQLDSASTSNVLGKDLQAKLAECAGVRWAFTDYETSFLDTMARLPARLHSPKQIALLDRLYDLACQKSGGYTP